MMPRHYWIGAALGSGIIVFGLIGALSHSGATRPTQLVGWAIGAAVFHDALLAPLVVVFGLATARWVPVTVRVPVRVGLALSGLVAAMAWPYVRGYGHRDSNPSALPFHYGRNLAIVVTVIWLTVAAATVAGRLVRRRSS
jgi:hypothetical protein